MEPLVLAALPDMLRDPLVSATAAVLFALLFAQSVLNKLVQRDRLRNALAAYRLLPASLLPAAGLLLWIAEALVVAAVLWHDSRPSGLALAAGLLALYGLAMSTTLLRGLHLQDCGCGAAPQPLRWSLVARNALLAGIAALAAAPAVPRPLGAFDMLAVAGAGLALWGLTHVVDELLHQGGRLAALRRGG